MSNRSKKHTEKTRRRAHKPTLRRYAMQPAEFIINEIFDGPELVAAGIGVHKTTIYRCLKPRAVGGTDGAVPPKLQTKLLRWARATHRDLRPEHFFLKAPPTRQQ